MAAVRRRTPSIRLSSRAIRFRESAIDAWVAERETGAAGREGDSQPDGHAHRGGYVGLLSGVTANPPPDAATTEETPDARDATRPGALLDGAGAGIAGRLDALEAELQQAAEAGGR